MRENGLKAPDVHRARISGRISYRLLLILGKWPKLLPEAGARHERRL
jgi:hypothetical protein